METGGSMPHSQGLSNNSYPEPNQPNSVGSCHHGMARPLGCGLESRPPDMEVSCEYIE